MFTISYGVGVNAARDEGMYRSISQVLSDSSLQSELSFDPAQVDARVSGQIVDLNSSVVPNMRIELVKKAGRKSSDDLLVTDNQLSPIGVGYEVNQVLDQKAQAAKEPFYKALEKASASVRVKVLKAQREAVQGSESFVKYTEAIIDRLVETNYVDSVGSLSVPAAIREELTAIAKTADEELEPLRQKIKDAELKIAAWRVSVFADLSLTVTIAEQKAVLAKVAASDPLVAWVLKA